MEKDVTQQRVWNTKQVITFVGFAIGITFSATMIWNRFLFTETQYHGLEEKIEYVNSRIDKKTDRNAGLIDKNTKEIDKLKMPNSDN